LLCTREAERQDPLHLRADLIVDPYPTCLLLRLFSCPTNAQRELKRKELLKDHPPMSRRTLLQEIVRQFFRPVELLEGGPEGDHAQFFAERFRQRVSDLDRIEDLADQPAKNFLRDVPCLRIDRDDRAIFPFGSVESLPLRTLQGYGPESSRSWSSVHGEPGSPLDLPCEVWLVEPDEFYGACAVVEDRLEEPQPFDRRDPSPGGNDSSPDQSRNVERAAKVRDARRMPAVLIAERKKKQQLPGRFDPR
jgi:hypothetical protein